MLRFCLKTIQFYRVYLGDHKYINIVFLWWLEVLIPSKISENI